MTEGQEKPALKLPILYQPIKYFVSSLNTFLATHLVARLRNEHLHPDNPNRILGTVVNGRQDYPIPEGVRKVIDPEKVKFFEEIILNSDVIVYDLNQCDLKQAQFVISTLKIHPFTEEKILICLSNVMTWARTAPKQKKEGDQQEGDENPPEEPDTQQQAAELAEGQQKKTFVRFTDKDYALRKPDSQYQKIKSIETLCLAAGKVKPNLRTYVVCSGLLYGEGQVLFKDYFMQARLQIPPKLPFFGKGKNRIPTVHVADLCTYIEKIVEKKPPQPYLLALDHNPKPSQRRIIEAIAKGIGTGEVQSVVATKGAPHVEELTINLRMKPSMVFAKIQQQQAAVELQQGSQVVKFKFTWRSKEGMQQSIQKLRQQFNKVMGLSQQKIFLAGPPGCGKTYHAQKLAQKYYLPHIHVRGVIEQVKELKNEFGQQIRNFLNEKKESQISTKQAEYDELKQKWKKIPKQIRQPMEPFNPDAVDIRLSDELLYKCFKWRLSQNDCLNRGYVLDGFPKKYEDARAIFMGPPPAVQGQEEEAEEGGKKVVEERLVPNKQIVLVMSDQEILQRIQGLPQEEIAQTHLTQKKIKALLKRYRDANNGDSGQYVVQDFFRQNKIAVHHVKISPQTQATLESLVRPLGCREEDERKAMQEKVKKQKQRRLKVRQQMDKKQQIIRQIQKEDYVMKKENEQNEERQILDKKSLALRKYLDVNLVPILSQGIVELLRSFPADPVDTLAQFLFKNSLKVPNPDPSTFDF